MRALLVVHTNTYFTGLLPLADALLESGRFDPVFLFTRKYPTLPDDIHTCQQQGVQFLLGEDVQLYSREQARKRKQRGRLVRYIELLKSPRGLAEMLLSGLLAGSAVDAMRKLSHRMDGLRKLIRREAVSLVIIPADNRYDQAAYVKAAHIERIGVVVIPQFMAGPLEWAEYVWDQPSYRASGFRNWLAGKLYPRWVYEYKGRKLIALPGSEVMAREWLGIAPPLPWVLHSGNADVLALESEAVRDYCAAEGLPPEKIVVTGSIAHDVMFEVLSHSQEKRMEFCRALGFDDDDRPLILSALPPDNLYMGRTECDFQTYAELVKFWCQTISSMKGYHHVVVLHPSLRYADMKHIEDYGLKIAREPTADVIPLCDIYVAAISSTIQWAIACGKPVVNYDVFRYRYTDYQNVSGVVTVEEQQAFLSALNKLTSDWHYYETMVSRQRESAEYWGRLDGKAGERLQALFASVAKLYSEEAWAT